MKSYGVRTSKDQSDIHECLTRQFSGSFESGNTMHVFEMKQQWMVLQTIAQFSAFPPCDTSVENLMK